MVVLLVPFTFSYGLSDFPSFLNKCNTFAIIGNENNTEDLRVAVDILEILEPIRTLEQPTRVGPRICEGPLAKLPEEIQNITSHDLILVGGPCANKITARIMGIPTTWPECAQGFKNGTGRLILYNKWNHTQIVVAGFSAEDTLNSGKIISEFNKYNLSGKKFKISGKKDNLRVERIITEEEKQYCEKNEDCIKAPAEPCGCWGGGKSISINKQFYNEYTKNYEGGTCVAVASDHISCFANPICINNRCDLDYKNYSVCEGLYEYYNQCYTQFAITNNNESICEKIILSHDGSPIKLRINECKNRINQFIIYNNSTKIKNNSRELIRSCPSYAHWDQMPCGGQGCKKSCYYIINGTQWDCLDVDREWILDNCGQINASITY